MLIFRPNALEKQRDWVQRHLGELLQQCTCVCALCVCVLAHVRARPSGALLGMPHQTPSWQKKIRKSDRGGLEAGVVLSREGQVQEKGKSAGISGWLCQVGGALGAGR